VIWTFSNEGGFGLLGHCSCCPQSGDVKPSVSSNGVPSIPDANAVDVCVVVWVVVVVGDVVTDVLVGEVVGVVTTHPWNLPAERPTPLR
jgi:hypothetical protein